LKLIARLGRLVVKEAFQNEGAFGDTVNFGDISVPRADADGWRPTYVDRQRHRVAGG
jgi:hypothetical protein